jgi:hypothetical protein
MSEEMTDETNEGAPETASDKRKSLGDVLEMIRHKDWMDAHEMEKKWRREDKIYRRISFVFIAVECIALTVIAFIAVLR